MKTNPLKQGSLTENSRGIGTVSREMVFRRAGELAIIDGRQARDATESDREQAKRELTGNPGPDPEQALLESAPESERWDPVPGSTGSRAEISASEDEDEEGQSDSARLVGEGVAEAGHDEMLQAARIHRQEDKES